MDPQEPLQRITDAVVRLTGIERERVTPSSRFIDFGIDSARAMEVVVELEEAYGVAIDDDDLAELQSLQDVAEYVARRAPGWSPG